MNGYYKCRLCGKEYYSCVTKNADLIRRIMTDLCIYGSSKELQSPTLIGTHCCDDGSIGVSDFIGFKNEDTE